MRKLILSLVAFMSLSFCLSVHAAHADQSKKQNGDLATTCGAFVVAGGVIWAVEEAGRIMQLDQAMLKTMDLTTVLATAGYVLGKRELMEASVKVPLILTTQKLASSQMFQDLLTRMPLFGDSLKNIGEDLKPLATVATYVLFTKPAFEALRSQWIDPYLGIPKQKD